jgi:hypothetical protein
MAVCRTAKAGVGSIGQIRIEENIPGAYSDFYEVGTRDFEARMNSAVLFDQWA